MNWRLVLGVFWLLIMVASFVIQVRTRKNKNSRSTPHSARSNQANTNPDPYMFTDTEHRQQQFRQDDLMLGQFYDAFPQT